MSHTPFNPESVSVFACVSGMPPPVSTECRLANTGLAGIISLLLTPSSSCREALQPAQREALLAAATVLGGSMPSLDWLKMLGTSPDSLTTIQHIGLPVVPPPSRTKASALKSWLNHALLLDNWLNMQSVSAQHAQLQEHTSLWIDTARHWQKNQPIQEEVAAVRDDIIECLGLLQELHQTQPLDSVLEIMLNVLPVLLSFEVAYSYMA